MNIFPAIDLYEGKAVRLYKGRYDELTVYNNDPLSVALDFEAAGAKYLHLVDLEGARDGGTPNLEVIKRIREGTSLFIEVGGGIRSLSVIEKYLSIGVGRVILGTAALTDRDMLKTALSLYGEKIAVGADLKDGNIAIKGWTERSDVSVDAFMSDMQSLGVKTVICTDISKDGAMIGTNRDLYRELSKRYDIDIIASGGVSSLDDVRALSEMQLYGAIIGKAYYTGAILLPEAIALAGGEK